MTPKKKEVEGKRNKEEANECANSQETCLPQSNEQMIMVHKNNEKAEVPLLFLGAPQTKNPHTLTKCTIVCASKLVFHIKKIKIATVLHCAC